MSFLCNDTALPDSPAAGLVNSHFQIITCKNFYSWDLQTSFGRDGILFSTVYFRAGVVCFYCPYEKSAK